jgi:dTMP kinase
MIRELLLQGDSERWDAVSETLLFFAARRDHVARTIRPALEAGRWVVCDRFSDSTLAYQGYGRGLPLAALEAAGRFAIADFRPDLTLILDLPVAEGLARAARLDQAFHEKLRAGFLAIAATEPQRCVVIDASGDVDAVHRAVIAAVAARLDVRLI